VTPILYWEVLDGLELDSGTVSEIGFAAALGKKCYGLRTDFRNSGDFEGFPSTCRFCISSSPAGESCLEEFLKFRFEFNSPDVGRVPADEGGGREKNAINLTLLFQVIV
jgi:hypothetical protein